MFFVQVLVISSDEAYKLLQILDLRNAELTIFNFWLTIGHKNEKNEYLIVSG